MSEKIRHCDSDLNEVSQSNIKLIERINLREEGLVLHNNGLSVKIWPRFKSFMVDHNARQHSDSAVFWHNSLKNTSLIQEYWQVQEDNTVFPECELKTLT